MRDGWLAPQVQAWLADEHGLEVGIRAVRKAGRGRTYVDHPAQPAPTPGQSTWAHGEASPHAKLSADQVRSIFAARPADWEVGGDNRVVGPHGHVQSQGQTDLAERWGVTRAIIRRIWNEEIWTSVTLEARWDAAAAEAALAGFVRANERWPTTEDLRSRAALPDPVSLRQTTGLGWRAYRRYLARRPDVRAALQGRSDDAVAVMSRTD